MAADPGRVTTNRRATLRATLSRLMSRIPFPGEKVSRESFVAYVSALRHFLIRECRAHARDWPCAPLCWEMNTGGSLAIHTAALRAFYEFFVA
jgi:hypothetical protein